MKTMTILEYKDARGEWRYSVIAPNGRKVADCAEGYKRRGAMRRARLAMAQRIVAGKYRLLP